MKKLLIVAALSLFLVGCGEPKLDMSSKETSNASLIEMKKDLSPDEAARLDKAVKKVAFSAVMSAGNDTKQMEANMKEKLHGKTAKEIFKMAKE